MLVLFKNVTNSINLIWPGIWSLVYKNFWFEWSYSSIYKWPNYLLLQMMPLIRDIVGKAPVLTFVAQKGAGCVFRFS